MWWMLLACQEPFDEDRHDLTDFRIVGMRLADAPAALLWSDTGLWSAPSPTLAWTEGTEDGATTWSLTATDADGHTESGVLRFDAPPTNPNLLSFTRTEADAGFSVALELDTTVVTHFSAPAGEFTETAANATDVDTTGLAGILPIVALSLDGLGGNRWDIVDLPIDVAPPWLEVGTQIFPTAVTDAVDGWWAVTVEADEGWVGIRFADAAPAIGPEEGDAVCGASASVAFNPVVLAEGTCDRDVLVGARVVVWGSGVPQ